MKSYRTPAFKKLYADLPADVKRQAVTAYRLFIRDPFHPSLRFKELKAPVWSVRIGRSYRALGKRTDADTIVWYWIGSHEDYNNKT